MTECIEMCKELVVRKKQGGKYNNPKTKERKKLPKKNNLSNKRTWFRFRCKIPKHIKGNTSSAIRNNPQCRHCNAGADEEKSQIKKTNNIERQSSTNLPIVTSQK